MASNHNFVKIFHPDYDPPELLFKLIADDGPNKNKTPYFVVYDAASAIANNPADGWLSQSQDGSTPIENTTAWIDAGNYFYHVSGGDKPWPVVANFECWSFPHAQGAPSHWQEARYYVPDRTGGHGLPSRTSCRITGRELALENAHIIPRAEKLWFGTNRMDDYGNADGRTGDSVADSTANCIWLTSDAHKIWDQSRYTIIPDVREEEGKLKVHGWRTHRLNGHHEVLSQWHNKQLHSFEDRAAEFFYARFVWDIFPLIQGFLHSAQQRRLVVYDESQGKYENKTLTRAERRIYTLNQGRARSASPIKRQRSAQPGEQFDSVLDDDGAEAVICGDTRKAFKRPRLLLLDGGQDSAVADIPKWSEDLDCESDKEPVLRHRRPSRSPDFLPEWAPRSRVERGRSIWRS